MEAAATILFILYFVVAYWAGNQTIYKNKVFIEYKFGSVFTQKLIMSSILGPILIPIAIIKKIFFR